MGNRIVPKETRDDERLNEDEPGGNSVLEKEAKDEAFKFGCNWQRTMFWRDPVFDFEER